MTRILSPSAAVRGISANYTDKWRKHGKNRRISLIFIQILVNRDSPATGRRRAFPQTRGVLPYRSCA